MNDIYRYYQAIVEGSVTVCEKTRKWYSLVVHRIESGEYIFSEKKANRAVRFIENFLRHSEGPLAPQLVKLELWQKACISTIFGVVDPDGNRQFREVVIITGRKNGKTLFASGIAEYMVYADGEYGAKVYFTAPKLEQAEICYNAFWQSVSKEPELDAITKRRRSDVYVQSTNSTIKALAFSERRSDGLNISCGVADEIASWEGDRGLKFYEVLKSSQGSRRSPLLLSISTAGYARDSIYDELYRRSTEVINGRSKETRLAPFIYEIDDESKWNDIEELRKSNPNLGVSVSVDYMLEEIRIAEGSLSKLLEFKCKYCNIRQNSVSSWLDFSDVQRCMGNPVDLRAFKECYAVAGIDLSQSGDLTSACLLIQKGKRIYAVTHFWLPSNKIEEATSRDKVPYEAMISRGFLSLSGENYVQYEDCYRWLVDLVENYQIYPLMVGYDKYCASFLVQALKDYGFHTDSVFQGPNLTPVINEAGGIIKDGQLTIGDNTLLEGHLLNVCLKTDDAGRVQMTKASRGSHIDGAAALIDALCVRQKYWDEIGYQLMNEG